MHCIRRVLNRLRHVICRPLIRIAGEANPPEVKLSILHTLSLLLVKVRILVLAVESQFELSVLRSLQYK